MQQVVVTADVMEAAGLGEELHTVATVVLPEPEDLTDEPVVCFGFPGGGYSRGYFTFDMPGASGGGQAGWHARRGWIFVACDHLAVGDSSMPSDPSLLTFENLAAANDATVAHVTDALAAGTLLEGYPAVTGVRLGIGQSMGGCLTIVLQGQRATFQGIGVLGYSASHTVLAMPPGAPTMPRPMFPRGTRIEPVAFEQSHEATFGQASQTATEADLPPTTWGFHYDDVPRDVVIADLVGFPERPMSDPFPPWASPTIPPCAVTMLSPGVVAPEAACITAPVLVAVGERDVCPEPRMEPRAYAAATDVTLVICPRMSHMHNFASTRERLWSRIHSWGAGVAESSRVEAAS